MCSETKSSLNLISLQGENRAAILETNWIIIRFFGFSCEWSMEACNNVSLTLHRLKPSVRCCFIINLSSSRWARSLGLISTLNPLSTPVRMNFSHDSMGFLIVFSHLSLCLPASLPPSTLGRATCWGGRNETSPGGEGSGGGQGRDGVQL